MRLLCQGGYRRAWCYLVQTLRRIGFQPFYTPQLQKDLRPPPSLPGNENAKHFVSGEARAARCFSGFFETEPDGSRRSAT